MSNDKIEQSNNQRAIGKVEVEGDYNENQTNNTTNYIPSNTSTSFTSKAITSIKCHNNFLTYFNIGFWIFLLFLFFIIITFFNDLSSDVDDLNPYLAFFKAVLVMYIPTLFFFFSSFYVLQFSRYKNLLVNKFGIKYLNKRLRYKNISTDVEVKKDLIGYSICMYHKDESFPYIQFNVETIHEANAIEGFINQKRKSLTTEIVSN